jgi:RNA polymerase sigma-70 factor (ECF subfamily)
VQRAIDQIDLERRMVFVLFELEQESCEDIARGLEIPLGTVHSRLHTARSEFSAALERILASERHPKRILKIAGGT